MSSEVVPPAAVDRPVSLREFLQIFTAVMLPMFLAAIDQTLLATATPAIAGEFGGLRDTTWIALGYLLAATIMVPLYGRLGDRHGRARMLRLAIVVFMLGSLACGLAQSLLQLAVARVVQGLGGGGLMVMSQALIGELARSRFQGYFAANFTLASICGPVVGGYVVAHASWRWLFLVNVPLMLFALWRVRLLPQRPLPQQRAPLGDLRGLVLFGLAVVCALVWVTFAGHRFAWSSATSLALGAGTIALGALLLRIERRVAAMATTVVLFASCFFACVFFLPIYVQLGTHAPATHAGLLLLPLTLGMVIGSTTTGRVTARTGRPTLMPPFGLSLSTLMLVLLGLLPPTPTVVATLCLLCGVGFGTVMPTAQLTIQSLAGPAQLGAAAALVSLARSLGAVLGTALFSAFVYSLLHGLDLDAVLHGAASDSAAVVRAFQTGFLAVAAVALCGVLVARRLPRLQL